MVGLISAEGIEARWMIHEFDVLQFTWLRLFWVWLKWLWGAQGSNLIQALKMKRIIAEKLAEDRYGAFLQPAASWDDSKSDCYHHRDENNGVLVAIVSSKNPEEGCKWRWVLEWNESDGRGSLEFREKECSIGLIHQ